MTDKELRKLSRRDLLELLLAETKENQRLEQRVAELTAQIADKAVKIEKAESIAQTALQLSGILETAQCAAKQYLENVKTQALYNKPEATAEQYQQLQTEQNPPEQIPPEQILSTEERPEPMRPHADITEDCVNTREHNRRRIEKFLVNFQSN